jgi:hypothetical protein
MALVNLVTGSKELSDFLVREMKLEEDQYRCNDRDSLQSPVYELFYLNEGDLKRTLQRVNCPKPGYTIINSPEDIKRLKEDSRKQALRN